MLRDREGLSRASFKHQIRSNNREVVGDPVASYAQLQRRGIATGKVLHIRLNVKGKHVRKINTGENQQGMGTTGG